MGCIVIEAANIYEGCYSDYPSLADHRVRVLAKDLVFQFSFGKRVLVMRGFEWDEASVPWYVRWAFQKSGKYAYPALPHDVLYYSKVCTRRQADREFLLFSLQLTNRNNAYFRYAIIRLFGWIYWNRKPSQRAIRNRQLIKPI